MAVLAVVALLVGGTSAVLAGAVGPTATGDAVSAQGAETTTEDGANANDDGTTTGNETTAVGDTADLTVLNQTGNGSVVVVERAVLPEGGFVVVHEAENVSGDYATADDVTVGSVIGNSTYLEPGVHSNVRIELNQTLEAGQTVVVMAHRDTDDNQQYGFPETDQPYTQNGSPVVDTAYFILDAQTGDTAGVRATGNRTADVTFEDQTGNGSAVVIDTVELPEGGFVSVRAVENGTVGEVVGNSTYLESGKYENLTVRLDQPLNESRNLVAMVHPDVNDNQVFDFPGEDQPYLAADGTLSDPAFISVPTPGAGDGDETTTEDGQ